RVVGPCSGSVGVTPSAAMTLVESAGTSTCTLRGFVELAEPSNVGCASTPSAMYLRAVPKSFSGTVKSAYIGSIDWTVTSFESLDLTMFPGSTRRLPVRPLMGEQIEQYSRLS